MNLNTYFHIFRLITYILVSISIILYFTLYNIGYVHYYLKPVPAFLFSLYALVHLCHDRHEEKYIIRKHFALFSCFVFYTLGDIVLELDFYIYGVFTFCIGHLALIYALTISWKERDDSHIESLGICSLITYSILIISSITCILIFFDITTATYFTIAYLILGIVCCWRATARLRCCRLDIRSKIVWLGLHLFAISDVIVILTDEDDETLSWFIYVIMILYWISLMCIAFEIKKISKPIIHNKYLN